MRVEIPEIKIRRKIILKDSSIVINNNSLVLIKGVNGSGKTLYLNKLYTYLNSKKINACFMEQSSNRIIEDCSILENICLSNDKTNKQKALQLLDQFGVAELANHKTSELSGGQRRLVCLLRCLFVSFDVLIMDEPTNDLDKETVDLFLQVLKKCKERCSIVVVSHDDRFTKLADCTYIIENHELKSEKSFENKDEAIECKGTNLLVDKKILKKGLEKKLLQRLILVCFAVLCMIVSFDYLSNDETDNNTFELSQNEIYLFVPVSDQSVYMIENGALPFSIYNLFNSNLTLSEKARLFSNLDDIKESYEIKFNLELLNELPIDFLPIEIFYFSDVRGVIYPIIDYAEEKGVDCIDTGEYLKSFDFFLESDNSIPFDKDDYLNFYNLNYDKYNKSNNKLSIALFDLNGKSLKDVLSKQDYDKLLSTNCFIMSKETCTFTLDLAKSFKIYRYITNTLTLFIVFVIIDFVICFVMNKKNIKVIRIFKNCGYSIGDVKKQIKNIYNDKLFDNALWIVFLLILLYVIFKNGNLKDLFSYVGLLSFSLIDVANSYIVKFCYYHAIKKAYDWRSRL